LYGTCLRITPLEWNPQLHGHRYCVRRGAGSGGFAPLTALCRLKPLIHFGAISYSLYILQLPAFIFMSRWSHWFLHLPAGDFLETLAGCAVAIAMAELSWRYFESPFLKLKDQFTVRRASSSLRASLPASPACL
jgi:peptidoglycan/LPS O-acetylase OafA/YrhL